MAVRQKSDSKTGNIKKPRVQVVMSEGLLAQLEEFAEKESWSVSKSCEFIIRQYFNDNPIHHQNQHDKANDPPSDAWVPADSDDTPDLAQMQKLFQIMKMAKEAGVL